MKSNRRLVRGKVFLQWYWWLLVLGLAAWLVTPLQAQTRKRVSGGKPQVTAVAEAAPAAPSPALTGNYTLVLQKVVAKKIWFAKTGSRDLAVLTFRACDTGSILTEPCQDSAVTFRIRDGQAIFPVDKEGKPLVLYGPAKPITGNLIVEANLYISHPQKFANVRDAFTKFAGLTGAAVEEYGASQNDQQYSAVGKFMQRDESKNAIANFHVELTKALGRAVCAGANPLAISLTNSNTLTPAEVAKVAGTSFKLLSFHKGAQAHTCWQNIIYDPLQAILAKQ